MFKPENYITPILLSYVDKYIKNFRPEDSQLSLWGGDVTFQNLDLRLEVLEQELQLPFSFISGHIHELLIHVPWTKLMSEPITITINTIECILKLKGSDVVVPDVASQKKSSVRSQEFDTAPPSYLQSVINKIVSNIQVICKNLILKYVEEDIVVSVNVKLLSFQSANDVWEAAFTEISTHLRKLITVSDLTICLDKRNAAGKIDTYQEPVLYRCSLTMHMLRQYLAVTINRASVTRLDIYCSSMEFGMTEQQIPMLMRIIMLLVALQQKQLRPKRDINADHPSGSIDQEVVEENQESWTSWAWSWVPSIGPEYFDTDWLQTQSQPIYSGHTLHMGFYVDYASFTFKVSESSNERGSGYYTQKKIKYYPLLTLRLQGLFSDVIVHELKWFNCTFGISQIVLLPIGTCSCSVVETAEGSLPSEYLKIGVISTAHKADSLFDAKAIENKGEKRKYNTSWDYHLETTSEQVLLERTPAFAFDLIYELQIPSDVTSEKLSEFGGDLEYSNLFERSLYRIVFGRPKLRVCSGLFHRISSLRVAASFYDYSPYSEPSVDPPLSELLPPSAEDYDDLFEFIPLKETRITILAPIIEIQLMDHPYFEASKGNLFRKHKKLSLSTPPPSGLSIQTYPDFPKTTLECQCIDIQIKNPMYTKRLIHTVCKLPVPPKKLFDACYVETSIKIIGVCSRLVLLPKKYTTIVTPCSASIIMKRILKPHYWIHPDVPHRQITFESESISLTGTRPKIMLVTTIIDRLSKKDSDNNSILNSSLIQDAHRHYGLNYIEFYIENLRCKYVMTISTQTVDASLGAIKGFVYEPIEIYNISGRDSSSSLWTCSSQSRISSSVHSTSKEIQQMLFVSGPEFVKTTKKQSHPESYVPPLITLAVQFPLHPEKQTHPSLVYFNVGEIKMCVDPLLYDWIMYYPKVNVKPTDSFTLLQQKYRSAMSDASSSVPENRRIATPHESIHSSSDRGTPYAPLLTRSSSSLTNAEDDFYLNFLKRWHTVWKCMVLKGSIVQCTIYFPEESLSAVGTKDIQEAVENALRMPDPPQILTLVLPHTHFASSVQSEDLLTYSTLPINLPNTQLKCGFPWTISVKDLHCYTLQKKEKLNFLKPCSLNITIGVSTNAAVPNYTVGVQSEMDTTRIASISKQFEESCTLLPNENKLEVGPLAICIHIDMTPINVTMSKIQVNLISKIMFGLMEVSKHLLRDKVEQDSKQDASVPVGWNPAISPTLLKESSLESISDKTPPPIVIPEVKKTDIKITAWIQWTIARFTVKILANRSQDLTNEDETLLLKPNLKLVLDIEDIVSSVDFQKVYLKVKTKLASAQILHFELDKSNTWQRGPLSGVIMKVKEDDSVIERQEDTSLVSVTITKASCQHTHALWGATSLKQDKRSASNKSQIQTRYITEIVVTTQAVDCTLPISILRNFLLVFEPLIVALAANEKQTSTSSSPTTIVNNQSLPLAYLECRCIRIIVPSAELLGGRSEDSVCMLQVDEINLVPSAVNPICRIPCRPDIYQHAGQSRILNIPGSDVEDRQYQLDINGLSLCSGTWQEISNVINFQTAGGSNLRTMRENPALEWNNLEKGKRIVSPNFNLHPLINKFDVSVVVAPAMVYKTSILVCGHSIEINLSDITAYLSLSQIKLASALLNEVAQISDAFSFDQETIKQAKILFSYRPLDHKSLDMEEEIQSTKLTKDSGIDTTDILSSLSSKTKELIDQESILKIQASENSFGTVPKISTAAMFNYKVPVDFLITGGKIVLSMYQSNGFDLGKRKLKDKGPKLKDTYSEQGYEGSEESGADDSGNREQTNRPLLFISLLQPNFFLSQLELSNKTQLSCFDVRIKISGPEYVSQNNLPAEADFPIDLLETKLGMPDSSTGIPPAFLTVKWTQNVTQLTTLDVEIGKPTRILCSLSRWSYLLAVEEKLMDSFKCSFENLSKNTSHKIASTNCALSSSKHSETYTKFKEIKSKLCGIGNLNVTLNQLVLSLKCEDSTELDLSIGNMKNRLNLSNRPERLTNLTTFENFTIGIVRNETVQMLLNPWSFSIELRLFWESWQSANSNPQIQASVNSDSINIHLSPANLKCCENLVKDLKEFAFAVSGERGNTSDSPKESPRSQSDVDQHYKDDLRAGAFQFVDSVTGNSDELPLPYQVMFWSKKITAMAWRYPQPRTLTKIRIFPVPYKIALDVHNDNYQILGRLEYWSECHASYRLYTHFYLSETEVCHLQLPQYALQPVACVWRVVLTASDASIECDNMRVLVSPRALAACMRIDSYFNKSLIPDLTLSMELSNVSVSLFNEFSKDRIKVMPEKLKAFTCDYTFPENHCFLTFNLNDLKGYFSSWNFNATCFDVQTTAKCTVLDYRFLTRQTLLEPCSMKMEVSIANSLTLNFISKPMEIKFGPSIGHTLAVSMQTWEQHWSNNANRELIVITRYVVCNDTNNSVRFGQTFTDENILLSSRSCHLYCWRSQKYEQMIRVGLEENSWMWSKPFEIDKEGTRVINILPEDNMVLLVTVKKLSQTQKQIVFCGQLILSNMLLECFELKIVEAVNDDKDKELKNSSTYIVNGKSTPPSFFLNPKKNYFLRLRFYGLESAWSGDIPLKENGNSPQPWLVKVPLQERGQFLSIWCRIVREKVASGRRILAMLWPLFMIKSNLPWAAKIHVKTPTPNVSTCVRTLQSGINGKGELQQLYCPGTVDHTHKISFLFENGTPMSESVPLNYSLADQKDFFKSYENENINKILDQLDTSSNSQWPYFGEELQGIDFVCEEQPRTPVQVKYRNVCYYSSALLIEFSPWCLLLNTLGCRIAISAAGEELCQVCQHGIVTPPRLDDTFNIGVCIGGHWNLSLPLQLAKSDWSQTFYMPKISGTVPLEGTIKTAIVCVDHIYMIAINSNIVKEMRLLKICSSHVLTNHTTSQMQVIGFALMDDETVIQFPPNIERFSLAIGPHLDKSNTGISILQWNIMEKEIDPSGSIAMYLSFSLNPKLGWSCPIRVDKTVVRQSISCETEEQTVPFVVTSHEFKGQTYIAIHNDLYPQLLIENKTGTELLFAQLGGSEDKAIVKDCQHFQWICCIQPGKSKYYTMPDYSNRFPDISASNFKLVIAVNMEGTNANNVWSEAIDVGYDYEKFSKIPFFGDVKVSIVTSAHTSFITIESTSQVEINAQDIRVRLYMHENDSCNTLAIAPNRTRLDSNSYEGSLSSFASSYWDLNETNSNFKRILYDSSSHTNMSQSLLTSTLPMQTNWTSVKATFFFKSFKVNLLSDLDTESSEICNVFCDRLIFSATQTDIMDISFSISHLQIDNQLYLRGGFDFPVVLIGQNTKSVLGSFDIDISISELLSNMQEKPMISVNCTLETWKDLVLHKNVTGIKTLSITIEPLSAFIEDVFINKLRDYLSVFSPMKLVIIQRTSTAANYCLNTTLVGVPECVMWEAAMIAKPVMIQKLTVDSLFVLLSLHSSVKVYIAIDQSPLQFSRFERAQILTTSYRLGHTLTMHYLSGALFGAGWMVGSLEILGSPGGLARAMGSGLRDFVSLPYHGILQGPWAFLRGVTSGSASLMKHITAGTLHSITKLASSVARNLDRLTLDEEHLRRTEEQRRQRPQGLTQGFIQGLTGFGISLLGAVGGIAHHPLQSVMSGGASPRGLAAGVGLGIVGVLTKPLSGAAELVALTGQGLLQGAGWNPLPEPRVKPVIHHVYSTPNSLLKYKWKYTQLLTPKNLLYCTDGTWMITEGHYKSIALLLTTDSLILVNTDEDKSHCMIRITELSIVDDCADPTLLTLKHDSVLKNVKCQDELAPEMDPVSRARVADYVKSTAGLMQLSEETPCPPSTSGMSVSPVPSPTPLQMVVKESTIFTFYVHPQSKNYLQALLTLANHQLNNYTFPVF